MSNSIPDGRISGNSLNPKPIVEEVCHGEEVGNVCGSAVLTSRVWRLVSYILVCNNFIMVFQP